MGVCERFAYEDIEALRVGRYGQKINTSCMLFRIGNTVIDTGPPNMWRKVKRFLSEKDIHQLLITHHHEDHCGNLARIKKLGEPQILAHEAGLPLLAQSYSIPFYRWLVWGRPRLKIEAQPVPELISVNKDFHLQPINTPGHSSDMTCYLEPNRGWVFTGDLYIAAKPKYSRTAEDPNLEIESLRHLLTYDFETVFCSHRGILENGRQAISNKLNYLLALREQVRHYRKVGDSIKDICRRFMGKEEFLYYFSFGDYAKANFIRAFANYVPKPDGNVKYVEMGETEEALLS